MMAVVKERQRLQRKGDFGRKILLNEVINE